MNCPKGTKLSIFNIVDKRIKCYSHNTNLCSPKPKSSFRHLKQGIQEFHRKYVLVPVDKTENNIVFVCRLHFINTLNRNLTVPRLTKRLLLMRRLSLIAIQMICFISLLLMLRNAKTNFPRCIGYLNSTKDCINLDSLPTPALALQQNCLTY